MVQSWFTPEKIKSMRPYIDKTVNDLLDRTISRGSAKGAVDLVEEFALPVPSYVGSQFAGSKRGGSVVLTRADHLHNPGCSFRGPRVPDAAELHSHQRQLDRPRGVFRGHVGGADDRDALGSVTLTGISELLRYLTELADKRGKEPKDDILSQLMTEQVKTGNLDKADAVQVAFLLLVAGNATMVNMISLVSAIQTHLRENPCDRS